MRKFRYIPSRLTARLIANCRFYCFFASGIRRKICRWRIKILLRSIIARSAPLLSSKKIKAARNAVVSRLITLREECFDDLIYAYRNDPSLASPDEALYTSAYFAVFVHRIAHCLHRQGFGLAARALAEFVHAYSGVDIHPAATVGKNFAIDHGTGVVIGETASIGEGVRIYHNVTLGATRCDGKGGKRHPTVQEGVILYAGATVLGGNTVVGRGAVIGANVFVTENIKPYAKINAKKESVKDADR